MASQYRYCYWIFARLLSTVVGKLPIGTARLDDLWYLFSISYSMLSNALTLLLGDKKGIWLTWKTSRFSSSKRLSLGDRPNLVISGEKGPVKQKDVYAVSAGMWFTFSLCSVLMCCGWDFAPWTTLLKCGSNFLLEYCVCRIIRLS